MTRPTPETQPMNAVKGIKGFVSRPLIERVFSRIEMPNGSDGCWIWRGTVSKLGYGSVWVGDGHKRTHRVVYEHLRGPVPAGLELDHLCRNPSCCNPAHLEPVTHRENMIRGKAGAHNKSKTHCLRGHPLSGDNVGTNSKGYRECRACKKLRDHNRVLAKHSKGTV